MIIYFIKLLLVLAFIYLLYLLLVFNKKCRSCLKNREEYNEINRKGFDAFAYSLKLIDNMFIKNRVFFNSLIVIAEVLIVIIFSSLLIV